MLRQLQAGSQVLTTAPNKCCGQGGLGGGVSTDVPALPALTKMNCLPPCLFLGWGRGWHDAGRVPVGSPVGLMVQTE